MNLYIVYNGYMGNGYAHCAVVAKDGQTAKELARKEFKKEADQHNCYTEQYYANLDVEFIGKVGAEGISSSVIH